MTRYAQRTLIQQGSVANWGKAAPAAGAISYGIASGGTSSSITDGGVAYTLLSFTSDGTLTVTKEGTFEFLMVGGGGPPGTNFIGRTYADSGGSGGEVRTFNMILPVGTYAVDVGANEAATIFATGTAYAAYVNLGNAGYVTGEFSTGSNDVVPIWRQIHSRGSARTIEVPFGVSNTTTSLATNVKYHLSGRGQCNGGANALNSGPTLTFTGTSTVFGSGGSYNNGEQGTGGGARGVNPTANRGGGGGGGDSNGGHTSGATGFVAVRFQ